MAADNIPVALNHAEHDCLLRTTARDPVFLSADTPTADIGLIYFDVTGQAGIAINDSHVFSDLMADAPSGLVGN